MISDRIQKLISDYVKIMTSDRMQKITSRFLITYRKFTLYVMRTPVIRNDFSHEYIFA